MLFRSNGLKAAAREAVAIFVGHDPVRGEAQIREVANGGLTAIEALWRAAYDIVASNRNADSSEVARRLLIGTQATQLIARVAGERDHADMQHYVLARLAWLYKAHAYALEDIDAALFINGKEARYWRTKGMILMAQEIGRAHV